MAQNVLNESDIDDLLAAADAGLFDFCDEQKPLQVLLQVSDATAECFPVGGITSC